MNKQDRQNYFKTIQDRHVDSREERRTRREAARERHRKRIEERKKPL